MLLVAKTSIYEDLFNMKGKNMVRNSLNVIYSSDDNYAQHMGVSIFSLLDKNTDDFENINIYIIDNHITEKNKSNLKQIIKKYNNANLFWIDFDSYITQLKLNMLWEISISSYARLFISSMLDDDIDRVLYLDCDMIINDSLIELWQYNLNGKVIGAVQDPVCDSTKKAVGLNFSDKYFNSGMLLIDVTLWRKLNIEDKITEFLEEHNGQVIHHDQGVLNGVLRGNVEFVPLKYNVMTIQYFMNREQWLKYFDNNAEYYSREEYDLSKSSPVIIHFTPSLTTRPWVRSCKHPLKNKYWDYIASSPWNGVGPEQDNRKWYVKIFDYLYRHFPNFMLKIKH